MISLETHDDAAPADAGEPTVPQRLVLFEVGEHRFGIPIESIREIVDPRPCTPLPGSPAFVCGLINLRGRLVTVLDLGGRLGLPAASAHPGHSLVILDHGATRVGLAVEEVAGIVEVDPEALGVAAESLRSLHIDREYLRGVGEADDRLFIALDTGAILRSALPEANPHRTSTHPSENE